MTTPAALQCSFQARGQRVSHRLFPQGFCLQVRENTEVPLVFPPSLSLTHCVGVPLPSETPSPGFIWCVLAFLVIAHPTRGQSLAPEPLDSAERGGNRERARRPQGGGSAWNAPRGSLCLAASDREGPGGNHGFNRFLASVTSCSDLPVE